MRRLAPAVMLAMALPCAAFGMTPEEVHRLVERTDRNSAPGQYESDLLIENFKPGGNSTRQQSHVYRKGDKVLVVITGPAVQKGQAILRDDEQMWMYLPNSGKVMRIGAKEQSMGGEASNSDLLRVDLADDYTGAYTGEDTVDGIPCHRLELKAKDRTVAYDRVIYWISIEHELPVKREFYSLSGKHLKTMYFRRLKTYADRLRPSFMVIHNESNRDYRTEITLEQIRAVDTLGDQIFTPAYLRRGALR